jgi:hypothetical protein
MAPAHRCLGWTIRANILFLQGRRLSRTIRDGVADQRASEANMVSGLEKRVRHLKRGGWDADNPSYTDLARGIGLGPQLTLRR